MRNSREAKEAELAQFTRNKVSPPGEKISAPVVARLAPSPPWVAATVKTNRGELPAKAIHPSAPS